MNTTVLGYGIEYYMNNKFVGLISVDIPDREKYGYDGRQFHVADQNIKIGKKTIKKGQEYRTMLVQFTGRLKG